MHLAQAQGQALCECFAGLALAGGLDRAAAEEDARMRAKLGSSTQQERPSGLGKRRRVETSSSSDSDMSTQEGCAFRIPLHARAMFWQNHMRMCYEIHMRMCFF